MINCLNESGPTDVKFFGVEPRVVSIADTEQRGFEFRVAVEPNELARDPTESGSLSETDRCYKEFFDALSEAYAQRRPQWSKQKPGP